MQITGDVLNVNKRHYSEITLNDLERNAIVSVFS